MSGTPMHPFPGRRAHAAERGPSRWLSSEWGISLLALVLAVLVWAVVWRRISDSPDAPLMVKLDLRTSPGFAAFYEGEVPLKLAGPRGEIEEAIVKLGSPYTLIVNVPDLETGDDDGVPYMVLEYLEGSDLSEVLKMQGTIGVSDAVERIS